MIDIFSIAHLFFDAVDRKVSELRRQIRMSQCMRAITDRPQSIISDFLVKYPHFVEQSLFRMIAQFSDTPDGI